MFNYEDSTFSPKNIWTWNEGGWENLIPAGFPAQTRTREKLTLDDLQNALENALAETGYNLSFGRDQIKFGKLLNAQTVDCVVISNADHPTDYCKFVLTVRTAGAFTVINTYRAGYSKITIALNQKADMKSSGFIGKMASHLVKVDQNANDEENYYYVDIAEAINELLK